MAIERDFDISLIAGMALQEKQIQQNYRPIIAVHKWFARRPGTLFRGLLLAEFSDRPLAESFFQFNSFPGRKVADPFMGGGTPLIEANRLGCDVLGYDVNPMATWIVRRELEQLDLAQYEATADTLVEGLRVELNEFYSTDCPLYGDADVAVKYCLWVKVIRCAECGFDFDLFPGYLIADDTRHPRFVLACADCGQINEVDRVDSSHPCRACQSNLRLRGPAHRGRCACPNCGHTNAFPDSTAPPRHRMFAIEYYNAKRRREHKGRFFKKPDSKDLARYDALRTRWKAVVPQYVPVQDIPAGDETDRLHRWGYKQYSDLFNERQLLGLELACRAIGAVSPGPTRDALATNLSDLLRYQNMLCRYDTMALKSLDVFSVHGFPIGLVQCESNMLGITNENGNNVGSGGWANIVDKYLKAKRYCDEPFEVPARRGRKTTIPITGEWIGERKDGSPQREVDVRCASALTLKPEPGSLDAVFTDPPYFGNVQYAELMDFCYVWLRRLCGTGTEGFERDSTRSADELTGNETQARGIVHFTEGLSRAFRNVVPALKRNAPLAFTFHHNAEEAYKAIGVAILDAGLSCTASLPCPAEMSGSIHIHGTSSSIVDSIFVCRAVESVSRAAHESVDDFIEVVRKDIERLQGAGLKVSHGDLRCAVLGHLTRAGVCNLRHGWDSMADTDVRLKRFGEAMWTFGEPRAIVGKVASLIASTSAGKRSSLLSEGDLNALPI